MGRQVVATVTTAHDSDGVPTLARLISRQKDSLGHTYARLEELADGKITAQRWQQLATGVRIKEFPEPTTIAAIARAISVDVGSVVLAAARSAGLDVQSRASELADMLPAAARELTADQRDAILHLVRVMVPVARDETLPLDTAAHAGRAITGVRKRGTQGGDDVPGVDTGRSHDQLSVAELPTVHGGRKQRARRGLPDVMTAEEREAAGIPADVPLAAQRRSRPTNDEQT